MSSDFDESPVRQSLKELREEYPDHQGLADEKYYKHRFGLPADTWHKRRRSIGHHFDDLDAQGQSPEDSPFYRPRGGGNQGRPQQQINPLPAGSERDSIDDDDDAQPVQQTGDRFLNPPGLRTNAEGDYQYDDDADLEAMFAPAGGTGRNPRRAVSGDQDDADADSDAEPAAPKLGWGSRLWNGVKAVGGILKNVTGYNAIRHGIAGAFRKKKIEKNQRKFDAAEEGLTEIRNRSRANMARPEDRESAIALQKQFNESERKIAFNRAKLGTNRKYRTGREWKNEWSRLFTGRDAKLSKARDRYQHGFDYAEPGAAAISSASSSASSSSTIVDQQQEPAPAGDGGQQPAVQEQPVVNQPVVNQPQGPGRETLDDLESMMRVSGPVDFEQNNDEDDEGRAASIERLRRHMSGIGIKPGPLDEGQEQQPESPRQSGDDYQGYDSNAVQNYMYADDQLSDDED